MSRPSATRATLYRSAVLVVGMQWSIRLIGLVSVFILARLLTPGDFGIIGLATGALALVELLSAVGLRQALLRIQEPEREHYDTAFTLQLLLFSAMAAIGLAAAPLAGSFYGQPALTAVMTVLSLRFLIIGFTNVGIIDFDREYAFGRDLRMRIGSRLAAFVVTVAAAFYLRSYWALVVGLLVQSSFFTLSSYLAHPYRPRFSLKRRAELLGMSLWIFVHALSQTIQMQIERLVLGRFGTAHVVGLFSVSKDLSEIFTQEIATGLNRVTFVTVARTGESLDAAPLRTAQILGAYAMIAAPMGFGLAATAEDAIRVLLGSEWTAAAPLLRIVAIYGALYAVYKVIASSLQASGHARQAAITSGVGAFCIALIVAGAGFLRPDAVTIALAALAANLLVLLGGIGIIARASGQGALGLVFHVFRPFVAAAAMMATVRALGPDTGHALVDLAGGAALGATTYPLFLAAIWWASGRPAGGEREALNFAERLLRRPAPAQGR
jgi:O-antigen/teichoic acid export membrane protein